MIKTFSNYWSYIMLAVGNFIFVPFWSYYLITSFYDRRFMFWGMDSWSWRIFYAVLACITLSSTCLLIVYLKKFIKDYRNVQYD